MNSYFQQGLVGCGEKKGRDEGKAVRAEQGTSESGRFLLHLPQDCSFLKGATKVWNTPARRSPVLRRGTGGLCMSTLRASPSR